MLEQEGHFTGSDNVAPVGLSSPVDSSSSLLNGVTAKGSQLLQEIRRSSAFNVFFVPKRDPSYK